MDIDNENKKMEVPNLNNCNCCKEKRYCKGCLCEVTETMFCYCGEFMLTKESTYTDEDLKKMNN
jgi:hypothetical protein